VTKRTSLIEQREEDVASFEATAVPGALIGTLVGFTEDGLLRVDVSAGTSEVPIVARSCVVVTVRDVGKNVVLIRFAANAELIAIGVIQPNNASPAFEVTANDENVTVLAKERITLKCGDASVTLQRDGKIVIRGKHVISQAAGVNRIRGGSVELN
jgi:hypothetical protein